MLEELQQRKPTPSKRQTEIIDRCREDAAYFVGQHCQIYNATVKRWIPFDLWDAQIETLQLMVENRQVIVCKARQLGLSWLSLCYILWIMLFRPVAAILLFSKRDDEAMELLRRLKGIYLHLPSYLRTERVTASSLHDWELSNGSRATAFATTGGRSYTASMVLMDEADFIPNLSDVLAAVQPTIDAGGQMIMISTVDKTKPESTFKQMFRAAKEGLTEWAYIFLAWWERPGRDQAWYEKRKAEIISQTGFIDNLHQEYPATVAEAFAPRAADKRISGEWLAAIYGDADPIFPNDAPVINGVTIYHPPQRVLSYVIGADTAEGNPTSDDSALVVLCVETGGEVAMMRGKFDPSVHAAHCAELAHYYNNAAVMVERNNHGHSFLLWMKENARDLKCLEGADEKPGWLSNVKGKSMMYSHLADYCRDNFKEKTTVIHSFAIYNQIASIEGSTLRAPDGQMDDLADAFALAQCGRIALFKGGVAMRQGQVKGRGGSGMVKTARRRIKR